MSNQINDRPINWKEYLSNGIPFTSLNEVSVGDLVSYTNDIYENTRYCIISQITEERFHGNFRATKNEAISCPKISAGSLRINDAKKYKFRVYRR